MDQVNLEVAGLLEVVRQPKHRDISTPGVVVLRGARKGAWFIPLEAVQHASERGHAETCQLLLLGGSEGEHSPACQMLGRGEEYRLKPLRAGIIERLGGHGDDCPNIRAISVAPFPAAGTTFQLSPQETDETFTVQAGVSLHLVQELTPLPAVSLLIALLHPTQILVSLFYGHLILWIHLDLR